MPAVSAVRGSLVGMATRTSPTRSSSSSSATSRSGSAGRRGSGRKGSTATVPEADLPAAPLRALPAPVFDRAMDVLGVNATMDGFTGRRSRLFAGRETAR